MAAIHETVSVQQELVLERMDVQRTARVLGAVASYLEAEESIRQAQGAKDESLLLTIVRQEHERLSSLIEVSEPGSREIFLEKHRPVRDDLDGVYDCLSEECPEVGFDSGEDRTVHYQMWGFDDPLIDTRQQSI